MSETASELAREVLALCRAGIVMRRVSRCLGYVGPDGSALQGDSRVVQRHLSAGHNGGCLAFGVPTAALQRVVRLYDKIEAWALLEQAYLEAHLVPCIFRRAASNAELPFERTFFQPVLHLGEEPSGICAVNNAVIVRERKVYHRAHCERIAIRT